MKDALLSQKDFWNKESQTFCKIYSQNKSLISRCCDKIFRKDMFERFKFCLQQAEPIYQRTFLDVGCGSGLYMIELAKKGAKQITGLDVSENMITISKEAVKGNEVENKCRFFNNDLLQYKPDSEFDVSIGIGLFDYVKDPLPVLKKMNLVTKDKIIISFPRLWTYRVIPRKIRLALKGCPVYFYTSKEVAFLMRESGFKNYKLNVIGKLYCVVGYKN